MTPKNPKRNAAGRSRSRPDDAAELDELELLKRAMDGVVPLKKRPMASRGGGPTGAGSRDVGKGTGPGAVSRSGPGPRVLRKLRRGGFRVEEDLDLHGLTRREARRELDLFLRESASCGLRCVRVVHGRGLGSAGREPVLKKMVPEWLTDPENLGLVEAFVQALPRDGGTGAVYVLLRKGGNQAGGRRPAPAGEGG